MKVKRLAHGLGAEVTGLDLKADVPASTIADIRTAWLEHQVLVFPGQDITPDRHITFSAQFGEIDPVSFAPRFRHPDYPEIMVISNKPQKGRQSETRNNGRQWHSDTSFLPSPASGSLLHCLELPDFGGDTLFTNMYMAYDTLSDVMKKMLEDLWAVHDSTNTKDARKRPPEVLAELRQINPLVAQPIVRVHPETGRKALYVSEGQTTHIVGMTDEESTAILQFLFAHSVEPEFIYRHRWSRHDIVMWDNRCAMHLAVRYDMTKPRHMHRTTLKGEPSGYLYQPQ